MSQLPEGIHAQTLLSPVPSLPTSAHAAELVAPGRGNENFLVFLILRLWVADILAFQTQEQLSLCSAFSVTDSMQFAMHAGLLRSSSSLSSQVDDGRCPD